VSITIKKEESPIVVPLLVSEDEETKFEERSPLPSLRYPTSSHSPSRASSRLSSYHTRSPALRYSPVRRGDSIYYPATPVRSPTLLEEPIDWEPIYHHGATTDSTLVPSSGSSRTHINPIGHALRRVFLPSEVSDLIREGLQLGAQQRAEEEQLAALWQRVHEACYSPSCFTSRLFVLVLTPYSSSVGTILLRLVSLHVPRRVHYLFPFPLVTDLTPFSELPTGRGLIRSSLLTLSC
jgi:hypothetical protein